MTTCRWPAQPWSGTELPGIDFASGSSYGMAPPPPAAAYQTPTVTTGKDAAVLAQQVELALVPRYADLAAAEAGEFRAAAVTDGQTCAARAVTWGAPSQAEPGIRT